MADPQPSWAERPWEDSTTSASGTPGASSPAKKSGSTSLGCLGIVVVVIGAAVACSVLGGSDGDDAPSDFEAEYQCQEWAREKLQAPSTAEFSDTTSTGGPASWQVSGTVDAENGFGAKLRATWSCSIRLDGDTWRGNATINE